MNEPKRIKWLLESLANGGLNDWENKFLASISEQYERKGTLSEAQYEKLGEVYERVTQ